jgi:hypothetical protein
MWLDFILIVEIYARKAKKKKKNCVVLRTTYKLLKEMKITGLKRVEGVGVWRVKSCNRHLKIVRIPSQIN